MKIKDLISKKDYDFVSYRLLITPNNGEEPYDTFAGAFRSESGKIIPLDGDTYSAEEEVVEYEEWTNEEEGITSGLTVICQP